MASFHRFTRSNQSTREYFNGKHKAEHWYRDNQVYFITARCRERFPSFQAESAKAIFWDRFDYYTAKHGFVPWVTTLLDNHYHTLGYLKVGRELGEMMRCIHGAVAKLVNDTLPVRQVPFWREASHKEYFDGCIRDELQCRRAYRYKLAQSRRHGICADYKLYPHTHMRIELDVGVRRALEKEAFMEGIPYQRYERG